MLPRTILKLLLISVALTVASVVRAQTPLTTCVSIEVVNGPTEVEQGVPVVFKATVTGTIHPTKPEFKWTVSAGTITSGQGTDEITVDSTGLGGVEITATVELAGAPPGCKHHHRNRRRLRMRPSLVVFRLISTATSRTKMKRHVWIILQFNLPTSHRRADTSSCLPVLKPTKTRARNGLLVPSHGWWMYEVLIEIEWLQMIAVMPGT